MALISGFLQQKQSVLLMSDKGVKLLLLALGSRPEAELRSISRCAVQVCSARSLYPMHVYADIGVGVGSRTTGASHVGERAKRCHQQVNGCYQQVFAA